MKNKINKLMKIEKLTNGYIKLTAENGIRSKITNKIYSEIVCIEEDIELYEAII
jgi:hypothetical protein